MPRFALLLSVLLASPAFARPQAAMDMQQQLQAAQVRTSTAAGTTSADVRLVPNPDVAMQDRLEALVLSGKCDEATTLAASYRNKLLIRSVKQACGN